MANKDFLHQILHSRRQCLKKIDEENQVFTSLHNELDQWKEKIIESLNQFTKKKLDEIKQKTQETNQEQLRCLDHLYSNYLSNDNNNNLNNKLIIEDIQRSNHSLVQISYPKPIDFNEYLQINLMDKKKLSCINLPTYQLVSSLPIHSNITSLFTTDDRFLIYYDYEAGSASLYVYDLKFSLEQSAVFKLRVPCKHIHGKIMHMEYCSYLQGFLLSTSSKFYLLEISNSSATYQIKEYFDLIRENFLGVVQKFVCHRNQSNFIYLLINSLSEHILIQIDVSRDFSVQKKWIYPQDDLSTSDHSLQLKTINDFTLGNEHLLFALTYQTNDHFSYELHLRSMDMSFQHRFLLTSFFSPQHICFIPSNDHQQFLLSSQKSKILSLYDITNDRIESLDELHLASEPEYIDFAHRNASLFLLRNSFHIAIYKQSNAADSSILLDQRFNSESLSSTYHY